MNELRITLLGRLQLENGGAGPIDIQGQKVQELLSYLLVFRDRSHPRERLAAALWVERSNAQSKSYLRRTLWQLQQVLETYAEPCQPFLLVESDWIQLNPTVPLWLDVAEMECAYKQVADVPGDLLDRRTAQLLHDTTALYRGELLEGWYQPWCISERERLQHIYLVLLDKLMRHCETLGDLEAGIAYGQRILSCDRAREHTHRQLMRLLHLARDRSGALRQYERCASALREELDVEPTQRTRQLYQRIRQDRVAPSAPYWPDGDNMGEPDRVQLQHVMAELEQIRSDLEHLQQRVTRTTDIVDNLLVPNDGRKIST